MLRFAILPFAELQMKDKEININKLHSCRKSIDETKVIVHIENLSDAEFEAIRYNPKFVFQSEGISELMLTDSWKEPEKVGD